MSGTDKLCKDMATLVNNQQDSDIQFIVGGCFQESGETIYDESATTTLYAHSNILRCRSRYFATMLDEEKNWKEISKGVIYKPNISPDSFRDVLRYIYTGDLCTKTSKNIVELIMAADEMDLEELSTLCQNELIRRFKNIFSDKDEDENENENESVRKLSLGLTKRTPIDFTILIHITPALMLSSSFSLSYLSQELLNIMLPNMSIIIKSPDAYSTFFKNISSEVLIKIIKSDNLVMPERSVWDLVLNWACYQNNLSKATVEANANAVENDKVGIKSSSESIISITDLERLKETLKPFFPAIRFGLLDPDDYVQMNDLLNYLLPRPQFSKLNRYFLSTLLAVRFSPDDYAQILNCILSGHQFSKLDRYSLNTDNNRQLNRPRMKSSQKIVFDHTTQMFLKNRIFETGGMTIASIVTTIASTVNSFPAALGLTGPNYREKSCMPLFFDLRFKLLFRASEHGFLTRKFHQHCDNKGPTLTIVRSVDGHLFGGVNFADWKSDNSYSSSSLNFLFALPDGIHRNNTLIFKNTKPQKSSFNHTNYGPTFGDEADLCIANSANFNNNSYSELPHSYNGKEASNKALAGAKKFIVSDYEVYGISEKFLFTTVICICIFFFILFWFYIICVIVLGS